MKKLGVLAGFLLIGLLVFAGTTTTNLSLYKPALKETDWGTYVNTNFDTIDTAVGTQHTSAGVHKDITATSATSTGNVTVSTVSGDSKYLKLLDADLYTLTLYKDTDGHSIYYNNEGANYFQSTGDTDDYLSFSTASNVPSINSIGSCRLDLTASSGTIRLAGATGTYNEDLSLDFESTNNTIGISSSTGVTALDFGSISIGLGTTGTLAVDSVIGANTTLGIGDNTETITVNSSDWDISATGAMTGIDNITMGASTLNATEWGYLDGQDQAVKSTDSPTFVNLTATGLIIGANTLTTSEWAYLDGSDQALKTSDAPSFSNLTVSGLTASLPVFTNGTSALTSSGTVGVDHGGTGLATLTDGGVLFGNGTGNVSDSGVLADGTIIIGDGATEPTTLAAFTAFNGTLKHESGGVEADVSGYSGLLGITAGATYEMNSKSELETAIGSVDLAVATGDTYTGLANFSGCSNMTLPQGTDVSTYTAEGSFSWDTDNEKLYIGNGTAVIEVATSGSTYYTPDIIARDFELVYSNTTQVVVNPGILMHGTTQVSKTATTTLVLGTAADWWDGATDSYAGGAGWCYIGVRETGAIKLLGANPPDVADTSHNTDGNKYYWHDGTNYWRVLGAIRVNTSDLITVRFLQRGAWVYLDNYPTIASAVSAGSWSAATSCSSAVPGISRYAVFGVLAADNDTLAQIWIKAEGADGSTNDNNSVYTYESASGGIGVGGELTSAMDSSQQISYRNHTGDASTQILVKAYLLDIR